MKCIILAAGFATRLQPLIGDRPKPLLEIGGIPIITHIIEKIPIGIETIVTTNRKFEHQFLRWREGLSQKPELFLEEVWREEEKLGALASLALLIKRKNLAEDLLIIAGDNYFEFNLPNFIKAYNGKNVLVAIHDVGDKDKAKEFGVVKLEGNRIIEFNEKPESPTSSLVATACYIWPPRVFQSLLDYSSTQDRDHLGSFIAHLVKQEDVYAYVFKQRWLDIGSIRSYLEAQRMMDK